MSDPNWTTTDNWKGESNGTGSGSTGPSAPQSGDDYIYFEASSNNNGTYYLNSTAISSSNISINFYYHAYGSNITYLKLESFDGTSWTERWNVTGQQQSSSSDPWTNVSLDLSAYTVTQLRFVTSNSGYEGDVALDNINVFSVSPFTTLYSWSTDASNGTTGWSATDSEDVIVTNNADLSHLGNYTLTVTDNITTCQTSDSLVVSNGGPTIISNTSFNSFISCSGSPGIEQSFQVSGLNLSDDITITPPSGYEVSITSGSSFASSLVLTQSGGSVPSSTIYIRLSSSASNGASGNVALTSSGASTINFATGAGTVNSAPTFTVDAGSDINYLAGGTIAFDATVSGLSLSTITLINEEFGSGSIPESNNAVSMSQLSSNPSHSGTHGYWRQETSSSDAECSGCISWRAYITSGSPSGGASTLFVTEISPVSNEISVSFNYGHSNRTFSGDASDAFKVYLEGSDGSNIVLVDHPNNAGSGLGENAENQTFSNSSITVTSGVNYQFKVVYNNSNYSNGLYGASIDNILISEQAALASYNWSTDAPNGTLNWSATNTEDITVTSSANANHIGNYSLTVTDNTTSCQNSDTVAVLLPDPRTYVPDDNFEAYLEANGMGDGTANNDSVLTSNIDQVNRLTLANLSVVTSLELKILHK